MGTRFTTDEGIELEVDVWEDGLVDGYDTLDFTVSVRVPGRAIDDAKLEKLAPRVAELVIRTHTETK